MYLIEGRNITLVQLAHLIMATAQAYWGENQTRANLSNQKVL